MSGTTAKILELDRNSDLDRDMLIEMLDRRFDSLDLESAKEDAKGFLFDDSCLDLWCPQYFKDLAREIIIER